MLSWLLSLLACGAWFSPEPSYTLAFGGDVTLGRAINRALIDPERRGAMLQGLPWLREADLTVVNGEGVIAQGGRFYDKGESRPYTYRAHPRAVELLREAGVDVVMVGNNHANDYGPSALTEQLDRLLTAGIDYAGGGQDAADARRPALVPVGDLVVAVIGADLTATEPHQAQKTRAGTFYLPGHDEQRHEAVLEGLRPVVARARAQAHLVFFSPHWGDNFQDAPTPATRRLAKQILDLGVDGILGHSAHRLQGVEVIGGKPVIYDAGNLLSDYPPPPEDRRSAVFVLRFDRAGVRELEAFPVTLGDSRSWPAEGEALQEGLTVLAERSAALGTAVERRPGSLRISCEPGEAGPRPGPPERRAAPPQVRLAPTDALLDALPSTARPAAVRFANGVELIGFEVLMSELRVPKAGNVVDLYLRTDRPQPDTLTVALRPRQPGRPPDVQDHLPGDWLWPGSAWPPGRVLRDQTLVRYLGAPEGSVELLVGLLDGHRPVPVLQADLPQEGSWVILPGGTYKAGAPRLWEVWPRP